MLSLDGAFRGPANGRSRPGAPRGPHTILLHPAKETRPEIEGSHAPEPPVFDYSQDFKAIDFRQHPELYRIGKGEQGVLLVEPYKGEILPHWRFKTVAEAKASSAQIYGMFLGYLKQATSPVPTWPASSSRWAGPVPAATPTTRAVVSTTSRPEPSCPGRWTPRRRKRRRCSTSDTWPPASIPNTSGSSRSIVRNTRSE